MHTLGRISKFLIISEFEWQDFKESVDELRSAFPGLHQDSQTGNRVRQLYSDKDPSQ